MFPMAIHKDDCRAIREEEGTAGGVTYHITKKGKGQEEQPVCFRRLTDGSGNRCSRKAGYGTWHLGEGACKFCGGTAGRKPTTGRHAKMARRRLKKTVEKYLANDHTRLMDLTPELATMRILFQEFIEDFPVSTDDNFGIELHRVTNLVGTIGTLVDKISRIESRNTLTAAQVLYLRVTMADILMKYIADPDDRDRAVAELADRVGGSQLEV